MFATVSEPITESSPALPCKVGLAPCEAFGSWGAVQPHRRGISSRSVAFDGGGELGVAEEQRGGPTRFPGDETRLPTLMGANAVR